VPHAAHVALDEERALRRAPCGVVEEREQRVRVRLERLARQPQRSAGLALDADQVPAPSSTVPRMR
jgi:hypothetical protein